MTIDDTDETTAAGYNRVECSCGLKVVTDDPTIALEIMEAHDCPMVADEPAKDKERWWHALFSLEGALVVFLIANALIVLFRDGK